VVPKHVETLKTDFFCVECAFFGVMNTRFSHVAQNKQTNGIKRLKSRCYQGRSVNAL
jgi:hypothetical protein